MNQHHRVRAGYIEFLSLSTTYNSLPGQYRLGAEEFKTAVQGIFFEPKYLQQPCDRVVLASLLVFDHYRGCLCAERIIAPLETLILSQAPNVVLGGAYEMLTHYAAAMSNPQAISLVEACLGKSLRESLDYRRECMISSYPDWDFGKNHTDGSLLAAVRGWAGDAVTEEMLVSRAATEKYLHSSNADLAGAAQILIGTHWSDTTAWLDRFLDGDWFPGQA